MIIVLIAWVIVGVVCGWHFAKKKYAEYRDLNFGVIESTIEASFTYVICIFAGFLTGVGFAIAIAIELYSKMQKRR